MWGIGILHVCLWIIRSDSFTMYFAGSRYKKCEWNDALLPWGNIFKSNTYFLYYTFINRFVKKSDIPYAKTRYIMYGMILLYNLINMGVIVENFKNGEENYLCAVNMGCIVLADLYLLYFVKMADEKNYYEKQLIALEQQAKVQYEYYLTQTKNMIKPSTYYMM